MATATSGKLVLTFDIYVGDEYLRREEISAESVTIGRGPAAMLRIDNDSIADLHAVINVNDDGTVQLLDLGDPGGTKVNGETVNNTNLRTGDQIEVGRVRVAVSIVDEQAFADEEATQLATTPMGDESIDDPKTDSRAAAPRGAAVAAATATAAAAPAPSEVLEREGPEDVMAFLLRSGGSHEAGFDTTKGKVLEVAQVWGDVVMNIKQYARGAGAVTAGPSEAQFYVPDGLLPGSPYKVFEWAGSQFVCNIQDKWSGFADIGEERFDLHELIQQKKASPSSGGQYQLPITDNTRVVVDTGNFIFFGQMAAPGKVVVASKTDGLDYPFLGVLGFMGFLLGLLAVVMYMAPPPSDTETNDVPDRYVEMLLQKPEEEKPQPKKEANKDAGEGAKAKKEEGKVGKKDAKMKQAKGNKVEMQQQQLDKEIAEQAGVLGAMRDGAADNVFGSSAMSSDLAGGIGGLIGAKGTQVGSGGLGARGGGIGGGGSAEGLGGLGTKGRGSGASGYGSGGGEFGKKSEGGISSIGGDPIILGALDKSLIDAVIKRHMNQIRYCYQRELTKNPNLGGKITIKFVIAKDGSVSKSDVKSSSMGNGAVEGCIADRFLKFQFPEPKGGGIVIVSYPFIFSPG
jgi:pSer/pThr/pTyr-binding forkhead associated (FHA) protein